MMNGMAKTSGGKVKKPTTIKAKKATATATKPKAKPKRKPGPTRILG
jgi:hypothetical protein